MAYSFNYKLEDYNNTEQAAGYPTYSSAYPQQPNVSSAYLLQPMGAQTVTVDQPKHVSVEQV